MSNDPKVIESLIIEALKYDHPMSKQGLIDHVAMDLGIGADESLIGRMVEIMADRMIILVTESGKYRLNE